jgi:hypothetical protein
MQKQGLLSVMPAGVQCVAAVVVAVSVGAAAASVLAPAAAPAQLRSQQGPLGFRGPRSAPA